MIRRSVPVEDAREAMTAELASHRSSEFEGSYARVQQELDHVCTRSTLEEGVSGSRVVRAEKPS